ncbi:MAG: nitrilase-related carbon-nitrogen hydrolase, partial [Crocinitomicaceae bacterium]
ENDHFASGENERIVSWRGWKIQLQICYDLRFPEIVRNRVEENNTPAYDLIVYVANWPEKRAAHWNALLKARAIENQSYVVGVNRVGEDANGFTYSGDSQIIDALGGTTSLTPKEEVVQTHVINSLNLQKIREMLPFLCDL